MINENPKEVIDADLYRYSGKISLKAFIKSLLDTYNPGFRFIFLLRKCAYLNGKGLGIKFFFYRLLLNHYRFKYGFDIHYTCQIDKGFYLGHFGGVTINRKVKIGKNVNISHGVTIGQINRGEKKGLPEIGNSVWIGPHAVVVGKIKVSDRVLIGPGAFVNFDVPPNAVVVGNPGKIVSYSGVEGYINREVA